MLLSQWRRCMFVHSKPSQFSSDTCETPGAGQITPGSCNATNNFPCHNGGSCCSISQHALKCYCAKGYTGTFCNEITLLTVNGQPNNLAITTENLRVNGRRVESVQFGEVFKAMKEKTKSLLSTSQFLLAVRVHSRVQYARQYLHQWSTTTRSGHFPTKRSVRTAKVCREDIAKTHQNVSASL